MEPPKTLLQAARFFEDLDKCEEFMRDIKWHGQSPACPKCGSSRVGEIKTRRMLRCKDYSTRSRAAALCIIKQKYPLFDCVIDMYRANPNFPDEEQQVIRTN